MRWIVILAALALAACGAQKPAATSTATPAAKIDPFANGRTIFMSGRDLLGRQITASPPAMRSSCMQCHRANGSGGMRFPDGAVSADLRHAALTTEQKHPYTVPLLERAISRGIDNEGQKLDPVMPRWRMSQSDLRDVATYVYEKLK